MNFFRFAKNSVIQDLVKNGDYWFQSQYYPKRLIGCLENTPLPIFYPPRKPWACLKSAKKYMLENGWKLIKTIPDHSKLQQTNVQTKKAVK
jgi:hypothetical protein